MQVSLGFVGIGCRIPFVGAGVAGAAAVLGRPGLGVAPLAGLADAADDGVGAAGDDGPVVVRVRVRRAGDGREEGGRRVAVPARGRALRHGGRVRAPGADGADARVAVLLLARGARHVPQVRVVARQRLLHAVLAHDRVRVAQDVADVVAGPFAHGVRLQDRAAVRHGVGLVADADLSVPLAELHAAFGRAVAAGHDAAVAVGFVEGYFVAGPVDNSIGAGCLGQAVGLFVGEQGGRGGEEDKGRVCRSHFDVLFDGGRRRIRGGFIGFC